MRGYGAGRVPVPLPPAGAEGEIARGGQGDFREIISHAGRGSRPAHHTNSEPVLPRSVQRIQVGMWVMHPLNRSGGSD